MDGREPVRERMPLAGVVCHLRVSLTGKLRRIWRLRRVREQGRGRGGVRELVEELRFIPMKREAGDSRGRTKEKINGTNNCSHAIR
jgi:hypothetical protein